MKALKNDDWTLVSVGAVTAIHATCGVAMAHDDVTMRQHQAICDAAHGKPRTFHALIVTQREFNTPTHFYTGPDRGALMAQLRKDFAEYIDGVYPGLNDGDLVAAFMDDDIYLSFEEFEIPA